MVKKGISLVGVEDVALLKRIREEYPDCWFELSYNSSADYLETCLPLLEGRVASIHLLSPMRDFFPNLASRESYGWSEREILKDAEKAKRIGAENLVLHPGYLVEGLVSKDYGKRLSQIKAAGLGAYTLIPEESVCSTDYIDAPVYRKAYSVMVENALRLTEKVQGLGLHLCLENLNPRAGYMVLHPKECMQLAALGLELCLDIGHLQVNGALFGFDGFEETKRLLDTGMVRTMHLHSNPSGDGVYRDTHRSIDRYNPQWKEFLSYGEEKGANLILEVLEEPERNIGLLFDKMK